MESNEFSKDGLIPQEGQPDRSSALKKVIATLMQLEDEGDPCRSLGRPAIFRLAKMVLEMGSVLRRARHPESNGFYYMKGQGCVKDATEHEKNLNRFEWIRYMVNTAPSRSLGKQMKKYQKQYERFSEIMRKGRSHVRGIPVVITWGAHRPLQILSGA